MIHGLIEKKLKIFIIYAVYCKRLIYIISIIFLLSFTKSGSSGLNWWDASAHFVLYLRFIQAMIDGSDHMFETLFWAGSICGSLIVMVPAVFTGQHSGEGMLLLNRIPVLAAQKITS